MSSLEAKFPQKPPQKTQKLVLGTQIGLRILTIALTLAATLVVLTSRQSTVAFGIPVDARYSYSPTFKFFAYANAIVCALSILSLLLVFFLCHQGSNPAKFYYFFLHDLSMTLLVLAGSAAATAEGYIGRYGNTHSGWMPICEYVGKFCHKMTASVILSYLSFACLVMLTILSASTSRLIQV